jgi:hypothetical protein
MVLGGDERPVFEGYNGFKVGATTPRTQRTQEVTMIRRNKSAKNLNGVYCLPTSTRFHFHEADKCSAFAPGEFVYVLQAADEDGYPAAVVLTSGVDLEWDVDDEVETQHAEVRKNLPKRFVKAVMTPDGTISGDPPAKGIGLPHWSLIRTLENGQADMSEVEAVKNRIETNRSNAKKEREATKIAKEQAKKSAAPTQQAAAASVQK